MEAICRNICQTLFPTRTRAERSVPYALYLFVVSSLFGFCLEVAFRTICNGHLVIPGFLCGPYLPIYGCGILIFTYLCADKNPLAAFGKAVALPTLMEFVVAWFFETFYGRTLWDYSSAPLHIGTSVSLTFSLVWGCLGMAVLFWGEPFLREVYRRYGAVLRPVCGAVASVMVLDAVVCLFVG